MRNAEMAEHGEQGRIRMQPAFMVGDGAAFQAQRFGLNNAVQMQAAILV
jgi:hypothetical protein